MSNTTTDTPDERPGAIMDALIREGAGYGAADDEQPPDDDQAEGTPDFDGGARGTSAPPSASAVIDKAIRRADGY